MKPYYQNDSGTIGEWSGCYNSGWQGEITPESFSHPAKFSRTLIRCIYEHALTEGWLAPGMIIADPFAGVALGALDAMWHGLTWVGIELEPKFVALGQQNIALWQRKYGSKEGWGLARIIQGDSRRLVEVVGRADLVCSSPPYSGCVPNQDRRGEPWFESEVRKQFRTVGRDSMNYGYGSSPGQLRAMKEGDFDCVVASPPYEGSLDAKGDGIDWTKARRGGHSKESGTPRSLSRGAIADGYGDGVDNIGNKSGDTFWSAAREIVAQCHVILKPGGHAIWVCKDFVRKGKRVPFSDQWRALCEAQGFRLVCRHRAMLVSNHGTQGLLEGGSEKLETRRISFFRRLAEKRGSPKIEWEDCICLIKPIG